MLKIKDIGEFGFIDSIKPEETVEDLKVGIGDDAAIISPYGEFDIVVTTDMLVEGTHFLADTDPFAIGYRSMCANLSDIAAMGAIPKFYFVSLGINPERDFNYARDIYKGFNSLAEQFNTHLAGGDTVKSDKTIISITLIGYVEKSITIERKGKIEAKDLVISVGPLGYSGAGLEVIKNKFDGFDELVKVFLYPYPQIIAGRILGQSKLVRVMMDNSDGLASCIENLVVKNGFGAILFEEGLFDERLKAIAEFTNRNYLDFVFNGGEDFGLVAVIKKDGFLDLSYFLEKSLFNNSVKVIGEITQNKEIILKRLDNSLLEINKSGYVQF
ncbi:MAG TPA: thiamine-phosphate kinase [Thermodesulfobium narugense]|uniref:Thiamine-monophosphate kinase n=1 Tax=Thermodesulfobium acidiphilum TaxID=1794699 RepID=A0A2R4VZK5_THEAF|nr:thiamine-phosphate kinase [Thermodesulfobium acidiphilum]AWB09850.1 thiamine-phosphate kinase [Thermodesulfobium acidiphilum]HEM56498.1 thiamine-phosphate kinase [Thermodesulfobium narugense]